MSPQRSFVLPGAVGTAIALAAAGAAAQGYPSRPLRLIVPFAPGGPTDILGRSVGQKLSESLGQQVVIENRGGAGGNIGAELVAKSPADGYTLLMGATSTHAINPHLYRKVGFDPLKDFAPVSLVANTPSLLAVHPAMPVKTVRDLIVLARARPGQLTYGSAGNGSSNHLAGVLLCMMAGIQMTHVPYKGSGPALIDVMAGQVPLMFNNTVSVMPYVKAGKLRAVALTSLERSPLVPGVPTVAESGLPGFEVRSWHGVFVPAGTPAEVITLLASRIASGLAAPEVRERLNAQGVELVGNRPDEFAAFVRAELAKWGKVVKASGARAD